MYCRIYVCMYVGKQLYSTPNMYAHINILYQHSPKTHLSTCAEREREIDRERERERESKEETIKKRFLFTFMLSFF